MDRALIKLLMVASMISTLPIRSVAQSQEESYKYDFGGGLGMSGYLGDANHSNMFRHPGIAANLSFRYLPNSRFALRTMLGVQSLSGNTADWDNKLPGGIDYQFSSWDYDLSVRAEFNFFPYGMGETYRRLRRWSPYLSLGVGVNLAACSGNVSVAPSIPMGFGVKYKLSRRWNAAVEFSIAKVFGDHVDGSDLSDLYQIKNSFIKNTDWCSSLSVSVSYEFGPRCVVCHRVN